MSLRFGTYNLNGYLIQQQNAVVYARTKGHAQFFPNSKSIDEHYRALLVEKIDHIAKSRMDVLCFQETGQYQEVLKSELKKKGYKQVYTTDHQSAYVLQTIDAQYLDNHQFVVIKDDKRVLINNVQLNSFSKSVHAAQKSIERVKGKYDYFILAGDFNVDRNDPQEKQSKVLKNLKYQGYTSAKTSYTTVDATSGEKKQTTHILVKKQLTCVQSIVSFVYCLFTSKKAKVVIKVIDSGPSAVKASYAGLNSTDPYPRFDFRRELSSHQLMMVEITFGERAFIPKSLKKSIQKQFNQGFDKKRLIDFAHKLTPLQIGQLFKDDIARTIDPKVIAQFNEDQLNALDPTRLTKEQVRAIPLSKLSGMGSPQLINLLKIHKAHLTIEQLHAYCFLDDLIMPTKVLRDHLTPLQIGEILKLNTVYTKRLAVQLSINGRVYVVPRVRVGHLIDDFVSEAQIDLSDKQELGRGSFGIVYRCPLIYSDSLKTKKVIYLAVKQPMPGDVIASDDLLKEEVINEMTLGAPNVAGGGFLLNDYGQLYLFQRLYISDGQEFAKNNHRVISQSTTMSIFGDVLRAGNALQKMNIFHLDLKPANTLVDSQNRVFISDLGGSFYFPPIEEMTPEVINQQIKHLSKLQDPYLKEFYKKIVKDINHLTVIQKIFLFTYVQTSGDVDILSTPYTANRDIEAQINVLTHFFEQEYNNPAYTDQVYIQKYNEFRSLLSQQMVHAMAATTLCMVAAKYEENLYNSRENGIFDPTKGLSENPLSPVGVQSALIQSSVTDPAIIALFNDMINSATTHITPKVCYSQFSLITA